MEMHTKGEWNNNLHDGQIFDNGGLLVASCYSSLRSPQTIKANAELIVKAVNNYQKLLDSNRELLEALELAKDIIEEISDNFKFSGFRQIQTAINNAKNLQQ